MKTNELPGYEFAKEKGYVLEFYEGNKNSATYGKDKLTLTCYNDNKAKLTYVYKVVVMKIGKFSFPNKNFKYFENLLLECIPNKE